MFKFELCLLLFSFSNLTSMMKLVAVLNHFHFEQRYCAKFELFAYLNPDKKETQLFF